MLRPDWEPRFNAWLERALATPHEFGKHDCMIAFAEAVEAQTGRDFSKGHRGKWKSRAEALRYLKSLGFRSLEAMIDDLLEPVPPAFAQRGDIVLADGVPGVVTGPLALVVHDGTDGHAWAPRSAWLKAWSVGTRTVGAGK
jgi:hypothetical protein